jgi:hypothetical protein
LLAGSVLGEHALCSTMTRDNGGLLIYTPLMIIASAANFWFYGYPTQLADDGMRSI